MFSEEICTLKGTEGKVLHLTNLDQYIMLYEPIKMKDYIVWGKPDSNHPSYGVAWEGRAHCTDLEVYRSSGDLYLIQIPSNIWQCVVRTKSLWPVLASNNCMSLVRTGPTVQKSRRASRPVLIVEACCNHKQSCTNSQYSDPEHVWYIYIVSSLYQIPYAELEPHLSTCRTWWRITSVDYLHVGNAVVEIRSRGLVTIACFFWNLIWSVMVRGFHNVRPNRSANCNYISNHNHTSYQNTHQQVSHSNKATIGMRNMFLSFSISHWATCTALYECMWSASDRKQRWVVWSDEYRGPGMSHQEYSILRCFRLSSVRACLPTCGVWMWNNSPIL